MRKKKREHNYLNIYIYIFYKKGNYEEKTKNIRGWIQTEYDLL